MWPEKDSLIMPVEHADRILSLWEVQVLVLHVLVALNVYLRPDSVLYVLPELSLVQVAVSPA